MSVMTKIAICQIEATYFATAVVVISRNHQNAFVDMQMILMSVHNEKTDKWNFLLLITLLNQVIHIRHFKNSNISKDIQQCNDNFFSNQLPQKKQFTEHTNERVWFS